MLLHILYLWSKIQISSQDTQRKISEQTEKNNSCLFQQGFPFAWSKFSYFHPCQINLQAPPMPEHLRLVKQVSFIHVQHWKSSKKNNYSAQVLFKWNASMRMGWKFRCEVALTTCPLHGEIQNTLDTTSFRDAISTFTDLLLRSLWKGRTQPGWLLYGNWAVASTGETGAWKLQQTFSLCLLNKLCPFKQGVSS